MGKKKEEVKTRIPLGFTEGEHLQNTCVEGGGRWYGKREMMGNGRERGRREW